MSAYPVLRFSEWLLRESWRILSPNGRCLRVQAERVSAPSVGDWAAWNRSSWRADPRLEESSFRVGSCNLKLSAPGLLYFYSCRITCSTASRLSSSIGVEIPSITVSFGGYAIAKLVASMISSSLNASPTNTASSLAAHPTRWHT